MTDNTTDALNRTTSMSYDRLGRVVQKSLPGTEGVVTYTYDSLSGSLNAMGRLVALDDPAQRKVLSYDKLGRTKREVRRFKNLGSGIQNLNVDYETLYEHDLLGRQTAITYPGNPRGGTRVATSYRYSAMGVKRISVDYGNGSKDIVSAVEYNEFGQMTSVTRGNGVITTYEYDVKGRVTNLLSTNSANGIPTALQNVNYTFNVANSITAVENTPEMDPQGGYHSTIRYSYKYDGLNRLVHSTGFYQRTLNGGFEVTEPSKKFELAYGYAQNGNMQQKEVRNPESHSVEDRWNYGYSNHSVTGIDSTQYGADGFYMQYDSAGNMIRQTDNSKNLIKEMQYDSNNRIKTVTNPSNGETVGRYWYDDQGFRVHKISRREVDGEMKEHELLYTSKYMGIEIQKNNDGGEIQNSYAVVNNIYMNGVRIAAVVPGGNALYYLTDQVDSVKVVVNDMGLPVSRMEYLPYGETWFQEGEENHTPKYNSQELDKETGYYFYNARYYDPEIARFVTADTVIPDQNNTQSWNRLSYVRNNPIMYKDPTGHIEIETNKSREGDVLLRTEGGKTEDIQKAGLDYGHAALVKNVKKDKTGNVTEMTVIDLGGSGVKERVITKKGSYVVNNQGKREADDKEESLSQYKSFRVGSKEEGKAALKKAESQKGEIEYDTKALLGLTAPPKVGMKPRDYAKADDKKMVCSEFVNEAYGGKFKKDVRGTTPDDIYEAQKNLGANKKGKTLE